MNKMLLTLCILFLASSSAWALPDQTAAVEFNGSNVIKTSGGTIYMISVNYAGVTAGDKIQIIDGANLTNGVGGTVRLTCIASGTNGNCTVPLTVGGYYGTSIYYKETKTGGNFFTDVQYF